MSVVEVIPHPVDPNAGELILRIKTPRVTLPVDAAALKAAMLAAIRDVSFRTLVIDCREMRRASTDVFAVLLGLRKRIEPDGEIRICHLDPVLEESIRLCNLHRIFTIRPTLDDALG